MLEPVFSIAGVNATVTIDGTDSYSLWLEDLNRQYTLVDGIITDLSTGNTRPANAEELAYLPTLIKHQQVELNKAVLSDMEILLVKMNELKTFLVDPDVQATLDRPNATMPTAQELNKTLKEIIRQLRRTASFQNRLARYVFSETNPELLDDVSDV